MKPLGEGAEQPRSYRERVDAIIIEGHHDGYAALTPVIPVGIGSLKCLPFVQLRPGFVTVAVNHGQYHGRETTVYDLSARTMEIRREGPMTSDFPAHEVLDLVEDSETDPVSLEKVLKACEDFFGIGAEL